MAALVVVGGGGAVVGGTVVGGTVVVAGAREVVVTVDVVDVVLAEWTALALLLRPKTTSAVIPTAAAQTMATIAIMVRPDMPRIAR